VNLADYVIVFLFMGGMLYVGSIFYRWVGSSDDFYLAGRQLTPFILAAVIAATNVNLYSFVGQAGIAYKEGISIIWQTWTGDMALVFSGLFVIPILRRLRIRTIPEFLELRYSKGVRSLVAVLWIFRLAFWLGVVLYTAAIAAQTITGLDSFTVWVLVFSVFVIVYTMLGGMWSVAFTDVIQFVLMLASALVLLPLAMSAVGWWPGLNAALPETALELVRTTGTYNWKFILAIFLLGIQWSCVDQGLLQRAFGAENTKTVARGLVLAGIITTPFALLWNLPGLAARVLEPGLANADSAIPVMISTLVPNIVLGFVMVGLISSQLSTISGNLNGVATIFTSDIYENVLKREASQRKILTVARVVTVAAGVFMIAFAYLVPLMGGAVEAYLTIIAIMDMPLFVIAIVYGLLWKRANWQGAVGGYTAGAFAGIIGQFFYDLDFNTTTFITAGVALVVTPIVSLITRQAENPTLQRVWASRTGSEEERAAGEVFHLVPVSTRGRFGLGLLVGGFTVFLAGIVLGSQDIGSSGAVAVGGMILYFVGGLLRAYSE
jgi:SSS family solute:Na+ symporter